MTCKPEIVIRHSEIHLNYQFYALKERLIELFMSEYPTYILANTHKIQVFFRYLLFLPPDP